MRGYQLNFRAILLHRCMHENGRETRFQEAVFKSLINVNNTLLPWKLYWDIKWKERSCSDQPYMDKSNIIKIFIKNQFGLDTSKSFGQRTTKVPIADNNFESLILPFLQIVIYMTTLLKTDIIM